MVQNVTVRDLHDVGASTLYRNKRHSCSYTPKGITCVAQGMWISDMFSKAFPRKTSQSERTEGNFV